MQTLPQNSADLITSPATTVAFFPMTEISRETVRARWETAPLRQLFQSPKAERIFLAGNLESVK